MSEPSTSGASSPGNDAAFLMELYEELERSHEVDGWHWNPTTPAVDLCVGSILVQHTSWANVERAIANLRGARALSIEALHDMPAPELAALIRPAGLPLTKARRLKAFAEVALDHGGLAALLALPLDVLRPTLLQVSGIGPETADCICLYGARHLTIVHDAYTQRLIGRLGRGPGKASYRVWQGWLMANLRDDLRLYQRFHAGIVLHCKQVCRARPLCNACPLADRCEYALSPAIDLRAEATRSTQRQSVAWTGKHARR